MKQLRLIALVLAAAAWTATAAFACDTAKGASASNAKGTCAAHGTSATAASASGACPATAACPAGSSKCKGMGTSATAASMSGCTAAMSAQCTAAMRAQCAKGNKATMASAASSEHCAAHANATTAVAGMDCCAGKAASASAASANGCAAHGARTSAMAKGAGSCAGMSASAMNHGDMKGMHADCSVCLDEATCSNDLRAAGVRSQVVALRNGAMIVYTADNAENVRSLQTTVARYNEHIMNAYNNGGDATLCGECKSFRGAMASGKFSRELVNVKNGCQILLTSTDRSIVRKIHDMTGAQVAARVRT